MENNIKERPILFNAEMVNALLAGRKTQTRRAVKWRSRPEFNRDPLSPSLEVGSYGANAFVLTAKHNGCWNEFTYPEKCPYGNIGDRLWVRETFFLQKKYNHLPPRKCEGSLFHTKPVAAPMFTAKQECLSTCHVGHHA